MALLMDKLKIVGRKRPTIFAHRGSRAYAPENTIAAFELAIAQGADGIELDARLTSDGQVAVMHDQTVDRTTNGTGRVDRMTLTELQALDAGSFFDASFKGEKVPSLAEVFTVIGKRAFILVELKNIESPRNDLPDKVVSLVRKFGLELSTLLASFNPLALRRAHRLSPDIPLGLLARQGNRGILNRSWISRFIPHQVLHPAWKDVCPSLVAKCHHRGCLVIPYVVNDRQVLRELLIAGIDGIITDNPPIAFEVLAGNHWHLSGNPDQAYQ